MVFVYILVIVKNEKTKTNNVVHSGDVKSLTMTQKYVQHTERLQEETVCLLGNYFQPRINTHLEQLCGSYIFPPKRNDSISHFWQIPNEIAQDMLMLRGRGPLVAAASMTSAKEEVGQRFYKSIHLFHYC